MKEKDDKEVQKVETLEEFLIRGNNIEYCKYRKPRVWEPTFNGSSKYDRRKGIVKK